METNVPRPRWTDEHHLILKQVGLPQLVRRMEKQKRPFLNVGTPLSVPKRVIRLILKFHFE